MDSDKEKLVTFKEASPNKATVWYVNGKHLGDIIQDVDGSWYYWPVDEFKGCWSAHVIKAIGNELDRREPPFFPAPSQAVGGDTACKGCGEPLKADNAWMTDGCPCNSPLGINSEDGDLQTIRERDAAESAADEMASLILGELIDWPCHEAKWQEAIDDLKSRSAPEAGPRRLSNR
jgi:hypothetical protein